MSNYKPLVVAICLFFCSFLLVACHSTAEQQEDNNHESQTQPSDESSSSSEIDNSTQSLLNGIADDLSILQMLGQQASSYMEDSDFQAASTVYDQMEEVLSRIESDYPQAADGLRRNGQSEHASLLEEACSNIRSYYMEARRSIERQRSMEQEE